MTDPARIEATLRLLEDACTSAGVWLSPDGRIGERDAERILGWSDGAMANKRRAGEGPRAYRLAGGGHRITIRLVDLAEWFEAQQVDSSNLC